MSDSAADTYGWDTVYAVRIEDVNRLIGGSGLAFTDTGTDPLSGVTYAINGTFGRWSVTTGGSGTLLNLLLPILSLDLTVSTGESRNFTTNGQAVVEVSLEFVLAGSAADGNGNVHNLQLMTSSESSKPAATLLSLSFGDDGFSLFEPAVKSSLQSWINANLDKFATVFVSVNLNRTADRGQFAFLYPTAVSYAYIDRGTLDTSILAVLCITGGRLSEGLQSQVSPNAIPPGARAGFLISRQRFLQDLVGPSLPNAFPGLLEGDYEYDYNGLNLPSAFLYPVVRGGSEYPVQLRNGSVTVNDTELTITAATITDLSYLFGINALCESGATYEIHLFRQSSGFQTLGFRTVSQYAQHSTQTTSRTVLVEDIGELILALAGLILGVLTDGIGVIIGGLVIGVLTGLVETAPDRIAAAGTDAAPSIDSLLRNSTALAVWPGGGFTLTSAALNGSLQLGGTIDA